jgi:hypothetical protein
MDLINPRAKLGRADEHLRELHSEARAFVETDPFSVVNEERAADLDVALLRVREYPPLRLGLILGDVLANWRSALDNLANELVVLNGNDPGKRTSFPIFSKRADFARQGSKWIKGMSEEHARIVEALQPFQNETDPTIRALVAVNEHVNVDKHRAINPALTAIVDAQAYAASFRREPIDTEFYFEVDPVGFGARLEDGMELAHIRWHQPVPNPKPLMAAEFPVEIAFGEKGLSLKALPVIRWQINLVVECFAPDFGQSINPSPWTRRRLPPALQP